ncbi:hypothetical protein T492DRAFT_906062, partial [Pavlovales sp. CCMP2436]
GGGGGGCGICYEFATNFTSTTIPAARTNVCCEQRGIRWTQGSSGRCRCACAHAPVLRRRQRVLPAGGQSRGTLARKGAALSGAERIWRARARARWRV